MTWAATKVMYMYTGTSPTFKIIIVYETLCNSSNTTNLYEIQR